MSDRNLQRRLDAACAAARAAGTLALRYFHDPDTLAVEYKGTQDLVSAADREVERLVIGTLQRDFPDDGFFGEEGGGKAHERLWVIDPIDGTANFVRGLPGFGISIAYVEAGVPALGVIYLPLEDALYAARRGGGAFLDGKPIRVSAQTDIGKAVIAVGFSYRRPVAPFIETVGRLLDAHCEFRRMGSAVHGMVYVADGRLDGYWEQHINSWDILAGIVLVREAGGWANDFLDGDGLTAGNPILACPSALRENLSALTGVR